MGWPVAAVSFLEDPGAGPGGGGSFLGRWPRASVCICWGRGPAEALASIVLKHNTSIPTAASVSQACASRVCVGTCAEEDGEWSGLTPDWSVAAETLPASLVWSVGLTWVVPLTGLGRMDVQTPSRGKP